MKTSFFRVISLVLSLTLVFDPGVSAWAGVLQTPMALRPQPLAARVEQEALSGRALTVRRLVEPVRIFLSRLRPPEAEGRARYSQTGVITSDGYDTDPRLVDTLYHVG